MLPAKKMITSRIIKQEPVAWKTLRWFQSPGLKTLDADSMRKLKLSLKQRNFVQPFNVWLECPNLWILDGCHRQQAMNELLEEGEEIADLLPANFISCDNRKDAAELVLLYSSIYAKVSRTGVQDFLEEFNLDPDKIALDMNIPSVNLESIINTTFDTTSAIDELDIEESDVVITQIGDIYNLGRHKLLCGDSTNEAHCALLMGGKAAQMVFTDPPYNLAIDSYITSDARCEKFGEFAMASGEMSQEDFTKFLRSIFKNLSAYSTDGSIHYVCMDWRHIPEMCAAWLGIYTEFKNLVVWNKTLGGMGTFYRSKHELVFVFKNGTGKHVNNFELGQYGRYRSNVWDYEPAAIFSNKNSATEGSSKLHPTPKPVQMVADAILDCSEKGNIILDLFGGSGTTLIAADMTGRAARLMEIDPRYCDVIVQRYQNYCKEISTPCSIRRNGQEV